MSKSVVTKLLYEAQAHIVTVEVKSGEVFRGYLQNADDIMNIRLDSVTVTARDGQLSFLEQIYLRGSQIRFIIVPDAFKYAPMFKRVRSKAKGRNSPLLRAKATQLRNQIQQQQLLHQPKHQ